jgi:N-acetylglucosaminyldiphosphoundecaprenol N-acetyl-beta-D-mannosaminyltransferase
MLFTSASQITRCPELLRLLLGWVAEHVSACLARCLGPAKGDNAPTARAAPLSALCLAPDDSAVTCLERLLRKSSTHRELDSSRPSLMGLPLDPLTPDQLIDDLLDASAAGVGGYVMTPNVDHLRLVTKHPELMDLALSAEIRVADGIPLIWASRLQGCPLPGRVAGSDLISSLSLAAGRAGRSIFLLGGNPGTARAAAEVLSRTTGVQVVGHYCPPFGFEGDQAELQKIDALIASADPDFVYLGLPFPKASVVALRIKRRCPRVWTLGLGISFSFISGEVRRAPHWVQRLGIEWLYRLSQEPRRLYRRYVLEGLPFAIVLFADALMQRWGGS